MDGYQDLSDQVDLSQDHEDSQVLVAACIKRQRELGDEGLKFHLEVGDYSPVAFAFFPHLNFKELDEEGSIIGQVLDSNPDLVMIEENWESMKGEVKLHRDSQSLFQQLMSDFPIEMMMVVCMVWMYKANNQINQGGNA